MALPEIRIRVLCQEEVISLQSSAQAEALRQDTCVQDLGTRKTKWGNIGRVKERKERGKGREINKGSCSLPGRGTLASCLHQEKTRDKRVPDAATGSGPLAGKLAPEYPSGQDVGLSEEESPPELPFVAGRGTASRA